MKVPVGGVVLCLMIATAITVATKEAPKRDTAQAQDEVIYEPEEEMNLAEVTFEIIDKNGPVEGCNLVLINSMYERYFNTGPHRSFSASIPKGDYRVEVQADGYVLHKSYHSLTDGAHVTIELVPGAKITGKILGQSEEYEVRLYRYESVALTPPTLERTTMTQDKYWELDGVRYGDYLVQLEGHPKKNVLEIGRTVVSKVVGIQPIHTGPLLLEYKPTISGSVNASSRITLLIDHQVWTFDADGDFMIRGVPASCRARLIFEAEGYHPFERWCAPGTIIEVQLEPYGGGQ